MNKVIELTLARRRPPRPDGTLETLIRQEDLEELLLLKRRVQEALLELKRKNDRLLWMALEGLPVEPGVHTARALLVSKRPYRVNGQQHYRLLVR